MKILGVSYGYHDSSASLVVDGRLVNSIPEERFTQQKHDSNFPQFAIKEILKTKNDLEVSKPFFGISSKNYQ